MTKPCCVRARRLACMFACRHSRRDSSRQLIRDRKGTMTRVRCPQTRQKGEASRYMLLICSGNVPACCVVSRYICCVCAWWFGPASETTFPATTCALSHTQLWLMPQCHGQGIMTMCAYMHRPCTMQTAQHGTQKAASVKTAANGQLLGAIQSHHRFPHTCRHNCTHNCNLNKACRHTAAPLLLWQLQTPHTLHAKPNATLREPHNTSHIQYHPGSSNNKLATCSICAHS